MTGFTWGRPAWQFGAWNTPPVPRRAPLKSGSQILRDTKLTSRSSCTNPCYLAYSLVPRVGQCRSMLGSSTARCDGDGGVVNRQLSRGESTPESIHILLPSHEPGSTEMYCTPFPSYIPPMGASSMSSESVVLEQGVWTCAEREGELN